MRREIELYVHIPFCVRKCEYCDFLSGPSDEKTQQTYMKALCKEIVSAGAELQQKDTCEVISVFFGGGTPSLVEAEEIAAVMDAIRKEFVLNPEAEVTIEANPGTVTAGKLNIYRQCGINRISFGCQSVHDQELKELGRIHTFAEFSEGYELARKAGFTNINVDLMSGLPHQSLESWEVSLKTIGELKPEHISAYSLIIEEGTPFYDRVLDLPDEEIERRMYNRTGEILSRYGYEQYEISNYALRGKECSHNVGYWERKEYLGLGLGAASLIDEIRFSNTSDMQVYLKNCENPKKLCKNREILSVEDQMEEFMFLGLRMTRGIEEKRFQERFGCTVWNIYGEVLKKYLSMGLLLEESGRIFLSREGISVSNQIMADFLL